MWSTTAGIKPPSHGRRENTCERSYTEEVEDVLLLMDENHVQSGLLLERNSGSSAAKC